MSLFHAVRARALGLVSIAAVGVIVISGCSSGGGGGGGGLASDQTLKFPTLADPKTLDPGVADQETDTELNQNMFSNVLILDKNTKIVPDLAASMPTISSDNLTITFKLRQDATFWNGDKISAKDVLYSWNRAAALQGAYASIFQAVEGYSAVAKNKTSGAALQALLEKNDPAVTLTGLTAPDGLDGFTVQVKFASPAGYFLSGIALQGAAGAIVDSKAVKQDPENWWANPATAVGSGAFKLVARTPKQSMDFDAVPTYFGKKPTLKHVHIDILQNASSAVTAWEQKKYDIFGYGGYSGIPVADVLRIKNNSSESSQLHLQPKTRTTWVTFNVGYPKAGGPFVGVSDTNAKNLRMAFALAVDKKQLVSVVCHDIVCNQMTGGIIAKGLHGYLGDNADPLSQFDAAKAKQLLQQADPDGSKTKNLTYTYDPENPLNVSSATFLQDQWQRNLNVHVNLQAVSHPQFVAARLAGGYVLSRDGWQADYDHPQDWFDNLYGAIASAGGTNSSGYDDPQFDQLAKTADAEQLSQADPTYKQMAKMLSDAAVYIPLFQSQGSFLIHDWAKGAGSNTQFDYYWNDISIQQH